MGKFSDALQRHDQKAATKRRNDGLETHDWYALLQYDRDTGRLDLADPAVFKDGHSPEGLLRCGLIQVDGRLTSKGLKACEHIISLGQNGKSGSAVEMGKRPGRRMGRSSPTETPEQDQGRAQHIPPAPAARVTAPEPGHRAEPETAIPVQAPRQSGAPQAVSSPDLVVLNKPYSSEAEQFRKLRSSIMFPSSSPMPRLVLVTSTEPGEGKSFVAANLAATIAMNLNHHVLLVDCDLRRPSLHRLFGLRPEPGLSDHLASRLDLASVIQRVALPRLSVVPAGSTPLNPAELLTSDHMTRFLDEVKNRYMDRFVVLDSPPPAVASELKILSGLVDGVVLVIKEGGPGREKIEEVIRQIGKKKIIGLVGNFASQRGSESYYYQKQYRRYHRKEAN